MDATQSRLNWLTRRRTLAMTLTLIAVAITAALVQYVDDRLGDTSTTTGWTLLASTASLYLLGIRKRHPYRRLGPVAGWLQWHVYTGTFASVVFLMHIGWPVQGWFESTLAAMFCFVAMTGVALGILSRTTPKKLAAIKQDYRLEQIPQLQLVLAREAHQIAIDSVAIGEGATLTEYYQRRLLPYFHQPRSCLYNLLPNGIKRRRLVHELKGLDRYLADQGRQKSLGLLEIVQAKDDLDYHAALQSRLRLMMALHVALTWALALMIAVHVVLVYRFQGTLQ